MTMTWTKFRRKWISPRWTHPLLMTAMMTSSGCSRLFWRQQADKDSYQAITEHLTDPRWALPRIETQPDIQSRFYDPSNPDCSPLPPDDPAANAYMHWVDGWKGYKGWHKFGSLLSVENPQWLAAFGISVDQVDPLTGEFMGPIPAMENVRLDQAVELAQIHNREYQYQIEEVYLAALAVTFQRFQFGVRYLGVGGNEPGASTSANFIPHGPGDNVGAGVSGGVSQLLPAGTQWAVEFANNTIWLFGGGSETSSLSSLSFQIVQPLLFGAGRKVGLEALTQSERDLLYQARVLARFRQELFTNLVGSQFGYLGLLQQVQAIRNSRDNIRRLEEQVERLLADSARNQLFANSELLQFPDDASIPPQLQDKLTYSPELQRLFWGSLSPISDQEVRTLRSISSDPEYQAAIEEITQRLRTEVATLDVLQLQSRLTISMNTLRAQERSLQDDLDRYKMLLGLPPDVVLTIDDSLLIPFEIIDPRLSELEEIAKDFADNMGEIDHLDPHIDSLRMSLSQLNAIANDVIGDGLSIVQNDLQRLEEKTPQRLNDLVEENDRRQLQLDIERAGFLYEMIENDAESIREVLARLEDQVLEESLSAEARSAIFNDMIRIREDLVQLSQNLTVVQVSVRVELIDIQPFEIALQQAVEIGLENRVDLMNARALVMDARRKVEVAANRLQSNLDLVAEGDINTSSSKKPFDFRGDRSRLRVGVAFTAPLDMIAERNTYRAAQIDYQRQRREYMRFEDQVKLEIREAWRQLFVLRQNLETSRRAVRLAALQFDSAVDESRAPNMRTSQTAGGSGLQGNNLLNALNAILTAQNDLVRNWVDYERNRLNIFRDMGIMEIADDGLWDDPFYRNQLNEHDSNSYRQIPQMDARHSGSSPFTGHSLGDGMAESDPLVFDDLTEFPPGPKGIDPRASEERPLSGEPLRSRLSRQSAERHAQ